MNEDFEIELQGDASEETGNTQLPMNLLPVGTIEADDVKVYIRQDVYKALEEYAQADTQHERGTILLGNSCEELGKTHVIISDYIEARYTDASASTLTFTHETWDYVNKEHDARYPDKKIIGWQHTHPGYGIFLSNYDTFIQENFFNLPFQIAYVIDPLQNTRGFFQWKNRKIGKLDGYYIYDEIGKQIKIQQDPPKSSAERGADKAENRKYAAGIILALLIAIVGIILSLTARRTITVLRGELARQADQQTELERTIRQYDTELQLLRDRAEPVNTGADDGLEAEVSSLTRKVEAQQAVIDKQQQEIDRLAAENEKYHGADGGDQEEMITHVVRFGDTLGAVCALYGVDYLKNRGTILQLNQIDDENIIVVGQTIRIPKALAG